MTEVYLGQLSPACAPSRTRNSIEVLLQISGSHPLLLESFLSGRMSSFPLPEAPPLAAISRL